MCYISEGIVFVTSNFLIAVFVRHLLCVALCG